jgi:hypothetical protein
MHNARFRLMAGLAGATLCLFAVTSYGQNPTTTTGSPDATAQPQPTTPATPAPTDPAVATDITTTETTTWSFPGGIWGILGVAALVLLILFALFRGRDTTVVKDTYVAPSPGARNVGTGTAVGDRNLNPRAAQGPGTTGTGGPNEPNTRL